MATKRLTQHQKDLRTQYRKEYDRITSRIRELQGKGYVFDHRIVTPLSELGRNPTAKDIKRLKNITPKKLRKQSIGFIETKTGELLPASQGIKLEKQQQDMARRINAVSATLAKIEQREAKRFGAELSEEQKKSRRQEALFNQVDLHRKTGGKKGINYESLNEEDRLLVSRKFGRIAKNEDWKRFFKWAEEEIKRRKQEREERKKERAERRKNERKKRSLPSGREEGTDLLPNEGNEPEKSSKESGENPPDEPGAETGTSGEFEIEENDESDEEVTSSLTEELDNETKDKLSKIKDEGVRKWLEDFERQKHIEVAKREYAEDGEAIIAGIYARIELFTRYETDEKFALRHYNNEVAVSKLKGQLDSVIQRDGIDAVARRLQNNANKIDALMVTIMYDSDSRDSGAVGNALAELSTIINGHIPSQYEQAMWGDYYDTFDAASDDDTDDAYIDEDYE